MHGNILARTILILEYLESVIAYLEVADNVKLQSPEFEAQLMVCDVSD